MRVISIHQPLFLPWWPYLEKIYYSDIFVSLINCQSEKGSCLSRQKVFDKWITKPVKKGDKAIIHKEYADGQNLVEVNIAILEGLLKIFNIHTPIVHDFPVIERKTERLAKLLRHYGATHYLAAEKAPDKYLDVELLNKDNITFLPFKSYYKKSTVEMLIEYGVEGCINILETGKKRFYKQLRGCK